MRKVVTLRMQVEKKTYDTSISKESNLDLTVISYVVQLSNRASKFFFQINGTLHKGNGMAKKIIQLD